MNTESGLWSKKAERWNEVLVAVVTDGYCECVVVYDNIRKHVVRYALSDLVGCSVFELEAVGFKRDTNLEDLDVFEDIKVFRLTASD